MGKTGFQTGQPAFVESVFRKGSVQNGVQHLFYGIQSFFGSVTVITYDHDRGEKG